MIPKLILSTSYDFGDQAVNLVPIHSRGIDAGFLKKHASSHGVFERELSEIQPIPGHTVLHVLAVGDEEAYGDNRNNDAFNEADNKVCHDRFKKHGHVFRNHRNWSPDLKTGMVVKTAHNDDMRRIELLIALENAKYAEELAAFENGDDIPVSMGSMQKYDVCSYCKHKAPTAKDHCEHIQHKLGEVMEDGTKIYMQNPDPDYFDISTVFKNADRIGLTLRKVAAHNGAVGGHELAEAMGLRGCGHPKSATLIRLAELEKRFKGVGKTVKTSPSNLPRESVKQLKQACAKHGVKTVIGSLHEAGRLLSFDDFAYIVVGQSKLAGCGDPMLEGGFQRLLSDDTDVGSLDGDVPGTVLLDPETEQSLHECTSMKTASVSRRILRSTIVTPAPSRKIAQNADETYTRGMSDLYLHYKLAFAAHPKNRDNQDLLQAVALSNDLRS